MSVQEYWNIYSALSSTAISDIQLSTLKQRFQEIINSKRHLEKVRSVRQLLHILEKRDYLNKENIAAFNEISIILNRRDLLPANDSHGQFSRNPLTLQQGNVNHPCQVIPSIAQDPIQRIHDLICTQIGRKWKELARHLEVGEGLIDEIDNRHSSIAECTREVLRFHRQNCLSIFWESKLKGALIAARNRELSNKVENILASSGYHL